MAEIIFANNAGSTLAGSISNVATACALQAGTGALFPNPTGGQYFKMTFTDQATGALREIVNVFGRSGDTITSMVRGQEGTAAQAWSAGDFAEHFVTAGSMGAMAQLDDLQSVAGAYCVDFGSADSASITLPTPVASLDEVVGALIRIKKISSANTGGYTIFETTSGSTATLFNQDGSGMIAGELPADCLFTVAYDTGSGAFVLQSPPVPLDVGTMTTGNLPIDTRSTGSIPIDTRTTGNLPIDTRSTGSIPIDTRTTGLLSLTTRVTGQLPMPNGTNKLINIYPTPGVFSFTVPAETFWIYAEVQAGGGGGAGYNTDSNFSGGGGGAGGYAAGWVATTPGASITVTVGDGGAAGAAGAGGATGCNGGPGESSSFGPSVSATGGAGGIASLDSAAGGDGGVGTVTSGLQIRGGYGHIGDVINNTLGAAAFGGHGGSSFFGGGKYSPENGVAPATPAAVGSGGGGGYGSGAGCDGLSGMAGIVIVRG